MARFISLSNTLQHNREYSNVALGMSKAGTNMKRQIDMVAKNPASHILHQDRDSSNVALGICKAGTTIDGHSHLVVKYSAAQQRL